MPTYEALFLLKNAPKDVLKATLKRGVEYVFESNGVVRKLENLGLKNMPYSISSGGKRHKEAHYFLLKYDAPVDSLKEIKDRFFRDVDVIRSSFFMDKSSPMDDLKEEKEIPCTLHLDLLDAPYRPSVQKLQKIAEARLAKGKKKFEYNNKLGFCPF